MKSTLVVTNRKNEEIEVDLDDVYFDCTFKLVQTHEPNKPSGLDRFIRDRLEFHPDGRVHADAVYIAYISTYVLDCTEREFRIALSSALRHKGAAKSVVSIKGIKLQGYKGVRLT